MKHKLAAASGAVLGYIHGGIPSAINWGTGAYKLSKYKERMAPIRRVKQSRASRRKTPYKVSFKVKPSSSKPISKPLTYYMKTPKSARVGRAGFDKKKVMKLHHQDMDLVKFVIPGPKSKYKTHKDGRISYSDTYAALHTGNAGLQTVVMGRYFMHRNQMTLPVNVVENDRSTWSTNIFDLIVNRATTGGGVITATSTVASEAVYIKKQYTSMTITNFENIAVHCEVYWLLCRREGNDEPTATWLSNNTNLGLTQPTLVQPITAAGAPAPGFPQVSFYGQDPTNNLYFKKFWRVLEKREFVLQAGHSLRMEFSRAVNKLLKRPEITGVNMQQGWTFVPMFIFKPAPVVLYKTTEDPSTANVNTGTCKVGVMQTDTVIMHTVPEKTQPYNRAYSSNLNIDFASAKQVFINPETGAEDDVEMAA